MERAILKKGIDVSKFQKNINWKKVKESGIEFAIIKIGNRGYSTGKISADPFYRKNMDGALAAELEVGCYFYATSKNEEEAKEEAAYCIEMMRDYNVTLPVVYDFEGYNKKEYRTYGMTKAQRTSCCKAFIQDIMAAGYKTMLYGSKGNIKTTYDISQLDYPLWIARYKGGKKTVVDDSKYFPDILGYSDRIAIWQYTEIGRVDGIVGNVDMDYMYINVGREEKQTKMIKPFDYKQSDYRWATVNYSASGEKKTIKSSGCGATAMANVLATLVSEYIDPVTCAAYSMQHGYKIKGCGTSYNFFTAIAQQYGISVRRINTTNIQGKKTAVANAAHTQALAELKNGNWLIACMGKGLWTSSGHYVTVYGYKDGYVYINDSASTKANRACNTWELFKSQVKYYWVIDVPKIIKPGNIYDHDDFVRECCTCLGAPITEIGDSITLSKTIEIKKGKNTKHNVVYPLQKALKYLGYYQDKLDKSAGNNFFNAVEKFQTNYVGIKADRKISARGSSWKKWLQQRGW